MSHQTTSESTNNDSKTSRVGCQFCDKTYSCNEGRNRHERTVHSIELANVEAYTHPRTGIKYFKCTTPGCPFMARNMLTVWDHRKSCGEVPNDQRPEEIPTQAETTTADDDLALGQKLFPFLFDGQTALSQSTNIPFADSNSSWDNFSFPPNSWQAYPPARLAEYSGYATESGQLPFDSLLNTGRQSMEEMLFTLSHTGQNAVPLDLQVQGASSSSNGRIAATPSSSSDISFSFASFDIDESHSSTSATNFARNGDFDMRV
ncbi:uncharacterized protein EV420DRAFT_1083544 [Desarmillaria tabescens]|uniref:C2H2-type domain-containing protein n=1 Tax=Armillaria tabescens TaxID=1929756 RepID=A0AA39MQ76_ARMTA|nr:uncharacterized protein EV420DRAFT_1083544 [Desarmillaria tabescens]KAK0442024.1 hypothetical protein EV420DRAFT_1083544 [Desarmillaria tabescens]